MPNEPHSPIVLWYPVRGQITRWALRDDQLSAWLAVYPRLDVLSECRKAWAWLEASPERRKTAKGMPRFLVGWLNRAERDLQSPLRQQAAQEPRRAEWRDDCKAMHHPPCDSYVHHQLRMEVQARGCTHYGVCATLAACDARYKEAADATA